MIFLDDITVSPLYFDDDPPVISILSVVTSTQIELDFNENIELLSAEDESNYTIDGGVGNPIDATRGPTDFSKVLLTFITDFPEAILLTLTASNIADEEGNILTSDSKSFIIYTVNQYDIVMNEILPIPNLIWNYLLQNILNYIIPPILILISRDLQFRMQLLKAIHFLLLFWLLTIM